MKQYDIKEYTETAQKARSAGHKPHSMGELIADQQRSLNDKQVNALYNAQIRSLKEEYKTDYNKARKEYMKEKKGKFMSFTEYLEKEADKGNIEVFSKEGIRAMKGRDLYDVMVEYTGSLTGEAFREAIDSPSTRG